MRSVLVAAIVSCSEGPRKSKARRFVMGLSCDELQFIAEFLGAAVLESAEPSPCSRPELAERIEEFQRARLGGLAHSSRDEDHKTILLLEFLCRSGLQKTAVAVRA